MKWYLILCLILPFFVNASDSNSSPFVWMAEKDRKQSYILGTMHSGVSLRDVPCSNIISNKIQSSDLILSEVNAGNEYEKLSLKEREILFTGSVEEKNKIMSKLPQQSQQIIKERQTAMLNLLKDTFPHTLVGRGNFQNLNGKSKNFLTKHGADTTTSHADLIYFINLIAYYKAYFSQPSIDAQIKQIGFSRQIEVKSLDDDIKINKDFKSKNSNKPIISVTQNDVEEHILHINNLIEGYKEMNIKMAELYQSYNINLVSNIVSSSIEDETILLKNRNELWLKKILLEHKNHENIFIVTGLRHLIGNHNMLDMLKNEGFHIERLTCN